MASSSETAKIFIHHDVFSSELGRLKLRLFFDYTDEIPNSLIIKEFPESELNIVRPTPAQQECSLADNHFQCFVAQKVNDGYLYGTAYSFMKMVGITV
ncbi:MAG: hypothetical protein HFJ57_06045 [Clostridia bacterium]|nr:hypothetical protein [Clostridia bacterium]